MSDFNEMLRKTTALDPEDVDEVAEKEERAEPESESRPDLSPAEAEAKAEKELAKILQVLSRGLINDELANVDVGKDRFPVWVRDRDIDIQKYKALGYRLENDDEGKSIHPTGDNRRRLGDVVLMSIEKDRRNLIEKAKQKRLEQKLDAGKRYYRERATSREAVATPILDE